MTKFRLLAPAGAPIPMRAILASAVPSSRGCKHLPETMREGLGVRHCFFVSSGRAALTVLLKVLQKLSGRREVVVPAYTCFSVPSAVVRAGLTVRLCDVDPKTLDLDQDALLQLDLDKVLCIIAAGLYGIPADLVTLEKIARSSGAFLIDDAAQCLGATIGGKPCGTLGDAGLYSLGRGKNLTAIHGGILVTGRDDLADLIGQELQRIPRPPIFRACSAVLGSFVYTAMLRPSRYWLVDAVPILELGVSRFDPNFTVAQLSSYQERLAARLLPLLDSYNEIRQQNANRLRSGVEGVEGIEIPGPIHGTSSVYLRFPILVNGQRRRAQLLTRLGRAGIGASASYPSSIMDIPAIERYLPNDQQPCLEARTIAGRIITLPTHHFVTSRDIERIVEIIHGHHAAA